MPDPAPPVTPSAAPSPPAKARGGRRRLIFVLSALVLAPLALFAGYVLLALHWSYSDGERAGYVQKFSRKGWVCKTWEGELAMVSIPGTMPQIFPFTVRDGAVAARIDQAMGQRVSLHYEEHRGLPTTCFGETAHFVIGVRAVGP